MQPLSYLSMISDCVLIPTVNPSWGIAKARHEGICVPSRSPRACACAICKKLYATARRPGAPTGISFTFKFTHIMLAQPPVACHHMRPVYTFILAVFTSHLAQTRCQRGRKGVVCGSSGCVAYQEHWHPGLGRSCLSFVATRAPFYLPCYLIGLGGCT